MALAYAECQAATGLDWMATRAYGASPARPWSGELTHKRGEELAAIRDTPANTADDLPSASAGGWQVIRAAIQHLLPLGSFPPCAAEAGPLRGASSVTMPLRYQHGHV